jgi:hypothetical protein
VLVWLVSLWFLLLTVLVELNMIRVSIISVCPPVLVFRKLGPSRVSPSSKAA